MWNLKRNDTNELTYKTERDSQTKKMNYGWQGQGIVREFGMVTYTLLYLKWITNKDLLYCTGNLLNVMWQPGWEGGLGGEWIHVYVWLVPSLSTWTMTTLSIGYTPIQNKKLKKKKPYLQIQSHSEILKVMTSVCKLWGTSSSPFLEGFPWAKNCAERFT